jgi:hypothetical protein
MLRLPRLLPLLLHLCWALPAGAGAWMREEGEGFLSFGLEAKDAGLGQSLFLEYGVRPKLTLGLDGWSSLTGDWALLAVMQVPLTPANAAPLRAAASLGAGLGRSNGVMSERLRLALHLGRGLEAGWLSGDLSLTYRGDSGAIDSKLSATWGREITSRCSAVLEGWAEGSGAATLSPSLVCRLTPRLRVRGGGTWPVRGNGAPALTLQGWTEF